VTTLGVVPAFDELEDRAACFGLSEPGRGLCQNLALELELPVLPPQANEFLMLRDVTPSGRRPSSRSA
jgi:hypothetical protein